MNSFMLPSSEDCMGFPRVESLLKHLLKHASMPMATTRAILHPICGHMNGGLSVSLSSWMSTNMTIAWFFFPFRNAQSIFLARTTVCNISFFIYIFFLVVQNRYADGLQLLTIHQINSILIFLLTYPIFLLTSNLTVLTILVSRGT